MTERALELLNIPEGEEYMILDVGCGSGISGSILSENNHLWIGLDISRSMLGKDS
jgi:18S rRNA (guanine1575-N7)-methyltransferase